MSLRIENVSHAYGSAPAVREVSFHVDPGEIFCLFGASGCGKTTLLRLIAGLENIQSGEIFVENDLVAGGDIKISPQQRPVGFVFQDFVLFPHLTVRENIAFGLPRGSDRARINDQLDELDLGGLGGRYPHEISGGQQQRVALARTLVRNPKAILLDEPFASIDAVLRKRLRERLRTLLKKHDVTSVLVTHDAEEALALGDRIGLMREGQIVEVARPVDLFDRPQTPEGARLFPGCQEFSGVISNAKIKTRFGEFSAKGIADGRGSAVIRDGAIAASVNPNGEYEIIDTRFSGPDWTVTVKGPASEETCHAQLLTGGEPGDRAALAIDESGIFVFGA